MIAGVFGTCVAWLVFGTLLVTFAEKKSVRAYELDCIERIRRRVFRFTTHLQFSLMSAARWRFQATMEQSLKTNAKLFGGLSNVEVGEVFGKVHTHIIVWLRH